MKSINVQSIVVAGLIYMCTLLPSQVLAGPLETGKITRIYFYVNNTVLVYLDGTNDTSVCSGDAWALSATDDYFNQKLSLLFLAETTGVTLNLINVTSECGAWNHNKITAIDYLP